jgi:hypothetical protein
MVPLWRNFKIYKSVIRREKSQTLLPKIGAADKLDLFFENFFASNAILVRINRRATT